MGDEKLMVQCQPVEITSRALVFNSFQLIRLKIRKVHFLTAPAEPANPVLCLAGQYSAAQLEHHLGLVLDVPSRRQSLSS